jgi:hypothetical protein
MPVAPIDGKTVHSAAHTTESGSTEKNPRRRRVLLRRLRLRLKRLKAEG